jgi:small subunit ribosomal protein S20
MPHTPSAKKRMRQYDKRRKYNRAYKKAIKESLKTFTASVKSGTPEQLAADFKAAVKKLDKAAARKVIHPNKAAHKKSQLALILKAKTNPAAPAATK